ncbi:hypothetical protein [Arthrobacter sp. CDRTa11]|uniref:hypothetical protein n=1 Tax=Arthrobacter sp. CDRTa11 TaxID=2651199 RepID=UPI002265BFC5|nr:hypothetical protein [Arthrobacter sp. CDRTa11]
MLLSSNADVPVADPSLSSFTGGTIRGPKNDGRSAGNSSSPQLFRSVFHQRVFH